MDIKRGLRLMLMTLVSLTFLSLAQVASASENCDRVNYVGPEPHYTGQLIDSHFHIPAPLDVSPPRPQLGVNVTLADIVCTLESEGTNTVFAFFPVFTSYPYKDFISAAVRAEAKYPQYFVPFLMSPDKNDVRPSVGLNKIKPMLNDYRGLFQGYGEMGLYDLDNRSADDFPPNADLFRKIYPLVRKHKLMVYFHPGENHVDNFEKTLAANPNIDFIVHGDQIQNDIDRLMDTYPNIYYSVDMLYGDQFLLRPDGTREEFFAGLADPEPLLEQDVATWKELIEAHPNQFIWSTDRGDAVWTYDQDVGQTLANYGRAFIAQLDSAVQKKFAYKNARRLMKKNRLY